jgi:hypothetical protein
MRQHAVNSGQKPRAEAIADAVYEACGVVLGAAALSQIVSASTEVRRSLSLAIFPEGRDFEQSNAQKIKPQRT